MVRWSARFQVSEEMKQKLEKFHSNLVGSELEEYFYHKIADALKAETNTLIASGFKDSYKKDDGQVQKFELDLLIINASKKTIFHREVKSSLNDGAVDKAAGQLNHGLIYFSAILAGKENWRYVRMLGFENSENKPVCEKCQPFLLSNKKTENSWWSDLPSIDQGRLF